MIFLSLAGHLAVQGISGLPETLDRESDPVVLWRAHDFLIGQCCGYDLRLGAAPRPRLVATPHYGFPHCEGPLYCSVLVVREDEPGGSLSDFRGRRAAVNMRGSHSGYNVLRSLLAEEGGGTPFFSAVIESGGHRLSLAAVLEGAADLAAIDCVTYGLIARHAVEEVAGLRILATTPKAPGLPYVTAPEASEAAIQRLRAALAAAFADPALANARAALGLCAVSFLELADYDPIVAMAQRADSLLYPDLI